MSTTPAPPKEPFPASHRTSKLALASVLFALLGIPTVGVTSIVGITLGLVSMHLVSENRGRLRGFDAAVLGIFLSIVTLLFSVSTTIPAFAHHRGPVPATAHDVRHIRSDLTARAELSVYAAKAERYTCEHDGRLPPPDDWVSAIDLSDKTFWPFRQARGDPGSPPAKYAMNIHLAGMTVDEITFPHRTVLFFPARSRGPLSGGLDLLRASKPYAIAFVDGHVEFVDEYKARHLLVWDPRESQDGAVAIDTRPRP